MQRLFVKGKQFWAIDHDDHGVTITEGTRGTPGTSKVTKFRTPEKAHAGWTEQLAKAIAAGWKPPKPVEQPNAELEAAIVASPEDDETYAVYADWLQSHGQPRGALAAAQAAIAKLPKGKLADLPYQCSDSASRERWWIPSKVKGAKALYAEHARLLREHALDPANYELAELDDAYRADWRHGFVRALWLNFGGMRFDKHQAVIDLLRHPSCRFLRSLTISEMFDRGIGSKPLAAFAKVAPRTLRHLHLGDFAQGSPEISWVDIGDVSPFYRATPDLTVLLLQGAAIRLGKQVELPRLRVLELRTGGLHKEAARAIAASRLPALETLLVWFGDRDYGSTAKLADIAPLLDSKGFPHLRQLSLANSEFGNELAAAMLTSKLLKQLHTLDLSMGSLNDDGAKVLADGKKALAHLDVLDLSDNYLSPAGVKLVKGLAKQVLVGDQREVYDWDETNRHYAAIGE